MDTHKKNDGIFVFGQTSISTIVFFFIFDWLCRDECYNGVLSILTRLCKDAPGTDDPCPTSVVHHKKKILSSQPLA